MTFMEPINIEIEDLLRRADRGEYDEEIEVDDDPEFPAAIVDRYLWNHDGFPYSLLFGVLVERSRHLQTHYLGDLYHDAIWLEHNLSEGVVRQEFWWCVRDTGTDIGNDPIARAMFQRHNQVVWHCTVEFSTRGYHLTMIPRPGGKA